MRRSLLYVVLLKSRGMKGEAVTERGLTRDAARKAAERLREHEPAFTARVKPMGWKLVA
jgi:hypothetical protein